MQSVAENFTESFTFEVIVCSIEALESSLRCKVDSPLRVGKDWGHYICGGFVGVN
jgi:hypothetical protein